MGKQTRFAAAFAMADSVVCEKKQKTETGLSGNRPFWIKAYTSCVLQASLPAGSGICLAVNPDSGGQECRLIQKIYGFYW